MAGNQQSSGGRGWWQRAKDFSATGFGKGLIVTAVVVVAVLALIAGTMGTGALGGLKIDEIRVPNFEIGFDRGITKAFEFLAHPFGWATMATGGLIGSYLQSKRNKELIARDDADRAAKEREPSLAKERQQDLQKDSASTRETGRESKKSKDDVDIMQKLWPADGHDENAYDRGFRDARREFQESGMRDGGNDNKSDDDNKNIKERLATLEASLRDNDGNNHDRDQAKNSDKRNGQSQSVEKITRIIEEEDKQRDNTRDTQKSIRRDYVDEHEIERSQRSSSEDRNQSGTAEDNNRSYRDERNVSQDNYRSSETQSRDSRTVSDIARNDVHTNDRTETESYGKNASDGSRSSEAGNAVGNNANPQDNNTPSVNIHIVNHGMQPANPIDTPMPQNQPSAAQGSIHIPNSAVQGDTFLATELKRRSERESSENFRA